MCTGVSACPALWGSRYTLPSEVCGAHTRLRCNHSEWQTLTPRLPIPPKNNNNLTFEIEDKREDITPSWLGLYLTVGDSWQQDATPFL